MKKSFVAMALILVLCMSQFLIGNAEGKAIDITDTVVSNDAGHYTIEDAEVGKKITATAEKTNWSFIKFAIDQNAKEYTTVKLVVEGKAGTPFVLKLEGGGSTVVELKDQTLTGEEQVIEWKVEAANLTETGGQMFMIFLNPEGGDKACAGDWITVKSVKLCTPDYVEPAVPETPETGDSFNMVPAVMMVLAAFVFVAAYAKKRAF